VTAPVESPELVAVPVLALCGHCEITRAFRRGLCRSCYRKLREAGCPLPPASLPGPEGTPALERWVRSLPDDVRREIAALLMEDP